MSKLLVVLLLMLLLVIIFLLIKEQEEKDMAVVYVSLIIKGKKRFSQVPNLIKEEVRQLLIDLELEYLIDEEA